MKREIAVSLFFIKTFSAIGFGLLYSSLILYLIQNLHMTASIAIAFTGLIIALHYSLSSLGGLLLGKWLSFINALILGTILQILALFLIYDLGNTTFLYWGCAVFLLGSLCSSAAINMIITERFNPEDHARERVFLWNYSGMNIGNIIGYSIAGYFQLMHSFKNASWLAAMLMSIALLLSFIYRKQLGDIHTSYVLKNKKQKVVNFLKFLCVLSIFGIIIKNLLVHSIASSTLLIVLLSIGFIGFLGFNLFRAKDKHNAIFFIGLAVSYLLFWSLYFLIPMGLTLFANYNVTRQFFGILIPPAWLPNINSFLIILAAPLLGMLFKMIDPTNRWTSMHKFILGLCFLGVAFLLLITGILSAHFSLVSLGWVVFCYVFLTLAELFIAPIGFASVGKYVERKYQSVMTGVWLSILGFGALIASKLSGLVEITGNDLTQTNSHFLTLFSGLCLFSLICAVVLYFFKQGLQKSIKNVAESK